MTINAKPTTENGQRHHLGGEAKNPANKSHVIMHSPTFFQRIRRRFFPTPQEKGLLKTVQSGLEEGRRAARINVYKSGRV